MNTAHASHPVTIEKLNEIWHFQAGPLFKVFTTLLADPESAIPVQNLQPKLKLGLYWNPIFKLLRPKINPMCPFSFVHYREKYDLKHFAKHLHKKN